MGTSVTLAAPAGIGAGLAQRLVAVIGTAAPGATLVEAPDGWELGAEHTSDGLHTAVYWANVTGGEPGTWTWVWSADGDVFGHVLLESGCDLDALPAIAGADATGAGPHLAPAVVLEAGSTLLTVAAGAGATGWADSVAADATRAQGVDGLLGSAVFGSGPLWPGSPDVVAAGPAPLNAYHQLYAQRGGLLVGQTVGDVEAWQGRVGGLDLMVLPPGPDGMPPAWDDPRLAWIVEHGGQPMLTTLLDGDPVKIAALMAHLEAMPDEIAMVWLTDRECPEGTLTAATYGQNLAALVVAVTELPADVRARVRVGPVLSALWTTAGPGRTLANYDPHTGDFLGVVAYAKPVSPLPDAASVLAPVRDYQPAGDGRPRLLVRVGAVNEPGDYDGQGRAAWMHAADTEIRSWTDTGWPVAGVAWQNHTHLNVVPGRRGTVTQEWRCQLDQRPSETDPAGTFELLPTSGSGITARQRALTATGEPGGVHVWSIGLPTVLPAPV